MPVRIQRKRTRGYRLPEGAIYVGRPTVWHNPFVIGNPSGYLFQDGGDPTPIIPALSREQAVELFRDLIRGFVTPEMHPWGHEWMRTFRTRFGMHPTEAARWHLRGKDLACWCPLDHACHASVWLELANGDR